MKISKLFAITLQSKTRLIFFSVAEVYNLLLGLYLKDFLVLSPMLLTFYLLSALPALFLLIDVRSKSMRAVIFVSVGLILLMNIAYTLNCRRVIAFPTVISLMFEVLYFGAFVKSSRKDSFVTKICVLAVTALILVALISAYNFVCKPEALYLSNGGATLWDTQTEELADEICADCDTDAKKVQAFYGWIVSNFEYDYDYYPFIQYFDVQKTLRTKQGLCFDFAHLFAAFCRSQNIPCYAVDGISYKDCSDRHTWNRVYYDGTWWNVDITNDITSTANGKKLYGFHGLEGAFVPDEDFFITKIY